LQGISGDCEQRGSFSKTSRVDRVGTNPRIGRPIVCARKRLCLDLVEPPIVIERTITRKSIENSVVLVAGERSTSSGRVPLECPLPCKIHFCREISRKRREN
jgi:hypothetical protein